MLRLFQIGDACSDIKPLVSIVKHGVLPFIQIGIPIILIVLGTIDLGKAVISSDDKEVKAAQSRLVKRCIYAVAVFFVVTLVTLLFNLVSDSTSDAEVKTGTARWSTCWRKA